MAAGGAFGGVTRFSLVSRSRSRQNPCLGGLPRVRRTALHPLLLILLFPVSAAAQVAMPDGVALAPFAVNPASVFAFADPAGGTWSFFLSSDSRSPLYAQHVNDDGSYAPGFNRSARALTRANTLVNGIAAAPDGVGGAAVCWFGI